MNLAHGAMRRGGAVAALAMLGACAPQSAGGRTRTYYVAADTITWDYLPGGIDEITGKPFHDSAYFQRGKAVAEPTTYKKTVYREYTDSTFKTVKARPPEWAHLGYFGPVLRGAVGDTIRVVFQNHGTHPYSMHPHGVFYAKSSEGTPYNDGTNGADTADDAVPPGGTHVYVWPIPERAGPGPMDGSSIAWMYHSHTNEIRDVNTGLFGPMIVTARGKAKEDGTPVDVDREFVMIFAETHEEYSWFATENLGAVLKQNPTADPNGIAIDFPYFTKFSINGYVRGAMPLSAVTMKRGERVRWYVMSTTNDFDVHAPHWHGNTVLVGGMRTDVLNLGVMAMMVADMVPDDPGIWLFHCHIIDHLSNGMQTRYQVLPN